MNGSCGPKRRIFTSATHRSGPVRRGALLRCGLAVYACQVFRVFNELRRCKCACTLRRRRAEWKRRTFGASKRRTFGATGRVTPEACLRHERCAAALRALIPRFGD